MKKLFISIIAVALSLSAMAASTAAARIKLVGSNATYAVNTVFLNEDNARNSSYESGYDAESMMSLSNPFSVLIYAYVGEHPCEYVETDNLDGLEISFTTNMIDADYTLQFSNVSGRELKLYDRVTKTTKIITEGESYAFSVDPAQVGQVEVNHRFVLGMPSYSVTMNEYGWASFSGYDDLAIPTGLNAYAGVLSGEVLNLNIADYIQANQGVILYGDANQTYVLNLGTGSFDFGGNDLKPSSLWESHSGTIFCLKGDALYQYTGATMPANKAYLQVGGGSSAPRRISLQVNAEQGVENVKAGIKAEKFVSEDGQILIKRGENVFNLQGQIVK